MKGRVIKYKPVAKLSGKLGAKKGGSPEEEYQKQKEYLSKFSKKLQEMIIYGKNPREHKYNIKKPEIKITNKQKLIEYIENYLYSQDLINALGMDPTIGQGKADEIKQAILAEIERYDPE